MAGEITDAVNGLRDRLRTIDGLKVYVGAPGAKAEYPNALIDLESIEYGLAVGGDSIEVELAVILSVRSGQPTRSWEELAEYLSPAGTKSIYKAITDSKTLGGAVDQIKVDAASDIERDPDNPAVYRATWSLVWVKS